LSNSINESIFTHISSKSGEHISASRQIFCLDIKKKYSLTSIRIKTLVFKTNTLCFTVLFEKLFKIKETEREREKIREKEE